MMQNAGSQASGNQLPLDDLRGTRRLMQDKMDQHLLRLLTQASKDATVATQSFREELNKLRESMYRDIILASILFGSGRPVVPTEYVIDEQIPLRELLLD